MGEARSFREWKLAGRVVMRGQRSTGRDYRGEPTFTEEQTTLIVQQRPAIRIAPEPRMTEEDSKVSEIASLHRTLDMASVVGEEYQGQFDYERSRYRELTGGDIDDSSIFSGGM